MASGTPSPLRVAVPGTSHETLRANTAGRDTLGPRSQGSQPRCPGLQVRPFPDSDAQDSTLPVCWQPPRGRAVVNPRAQAWNTVYSERRHWKGQHGAGLSPRLAAGANPAGPGVSALSAGSRVTAFFHCRDLRSEGGWPGARPESSRLLAWTRPLWCSASHVVVEGRAWGLQEGEDLTTSSFRRKMASGHTPSQLWMLPLRHPGLGRPGGVIYSRGWGGGLAPWPQEKGGAIRKASWKQRCGSDRAPWSLACVSARGCAAPGTAGVVGKVPALAEVRRLEAVRAEPQQPPHPRPTDSAPDVGGQSQASEGRRPGRGACRFGGPEPQPQILP